MSFRAERVRLFFALFPPASVRRSIVAVQKLSSMEAKAVDPCQFHITLAFLGNQPKARLGELRELAAGCGLPSCALRLDRVVTFSRSAVTVLEASNPPAELVIFRKQLGECLEASGFMLDQRAWRPHVTLYRKMRKPCPRIAFEPIDWPLQTYCLVASRLEKSGPIYRVVERWRSAA